MPMEVLALKKFQVQLQPKGIVIEVAQGDTVMDAINKGNIAFDFPCGGKGTCGKCSVKVEGQGTKLACKTKVEENITVVIPESNDKQHQILLDTTKKEVVIAPHMAKYFVQVAPPSLEQSKSDWFRFKQALGKQQLAAKLTLLRQLPDLLRMSEQGEQGVTAVAFDDEVLDIEQGDTREKLLGMAFDIGTTTIVDFLMDLNEGKELAVVSSINPQARYGADVITRISFAQKDEQGLDKLHKAVIDTMNQLIAEAAEKVGMNKQHIYTVMVAGNTTMHHLFLGINPKNLSLSPYVAVYNDQLILKARELDIQINPQGKIITIPNIGGFIGADTMAVLLMAELEKSQEVKLIVDIGTNGEIVLGSSKQMVSCSAAAGPAFEGAEITFGMRGADGAIDHVFFKDKVQYSVIGGGKPKGICGSALLDVVAGLLELGFINKRGNLLAKENIVDEQGQKFKNNIITYAGEIAFLLVEGSLTEHGKPIVVTQSDIRQLQLAKGAIIAGIRILLDKCEIKVSEITEVLLAGAFGNYMNPHSACVIGLIPKELESKVKAIGNAAGTGTKLALLSKNEFQRAIELASMVEHVELASYPNFMTIFATGTYF